MKEEIKPVTELKESDEEKFKSDEEKFNNLSDFDREKKIEDYKNALLEKIRGFTAYNYYYLMRKYPKAMKKLIEDLESYSETRDLNENTLVPLFLYNNRTTLFSFFDKEEVGIHVNIIGSEFIWSYEIYKKGQKVSDTTDNNSFTNRSESEMEAFDKAFEILEKSLK